MKRGLLFLLIAFVILGFPGCGDRADGAAGPAAKLAEVNDAEDAYDLMGMEYQAFLEKYDESMIEDFVEGESAGSMEAEYYYKLKNGIEAGIYNNKVISVRAYYDKETEYPVPLFYKTGGGDGYETVVNRLGNPQYEGLETPGGEEELLAAVFYIGEHRYLKIYFGKETKTVSFISCFYGEGPDSHEANTIKVGDSLDDLKAEYPELYYAEAYYDPSKGEPKHNRVYYAPMEDRDRGVECIEFYLYEKEIVKISSNTYDVLGWRNYEDIFGKKDVFKEINMIGHKGSIVYFYDDAAGDEQVLLKVENCATEEIDIDGDGITEIIANKAGETRAMVVYDFDGKTEAITKLDVCEELGAAWSGYMGNAANVKEEYSKCIEAGFYEADGTTRTEVYSYSDNRLEYVGSYHQSMFQ